MRQEPQHLQTWTETYPGGLATFQAWEIGTGGFRYQCTIEQVLDMRESSYEALNKEEIQKLFERREAFRQYL